VVTNGGDAESKKLVADGNARRKPIVKDWGSLPVASHVCPASRLFALTGNTVRNDGQV